jgi:hypothetical protein
MLAVHEACQTCLIPGQMARSETYTPGSRVKTAGLTPRFDRSDVARVLDA